MEYARYAQTVALKPALSNPNALIVMELSLTLRPEDVKILVQESLGRRILSRSAGNLMTIPSSYM